MSFRLCGGCAILAATLLTGRVGAEGRASWFNPWQTAPDRGRPVIQTYPVAEFVVPIKDSDGRDCRWWAKTDKPVKGNRTCEEALIRLIQTTVEPSCWQALGGTGTLDYFPRTMTLVVHQTPDVQEQVADLLAELRREQNTEVCLEVRVVSVSPEIAKGLESVWYRHEATQTNSPPCSANPCHPVSFINDFTPDGYLSGLTPACEPKSGPMFLNDTQLFMFMEAIQGDQHTDVMQAPKITALNGQKVHVECADKQTFVTGVETVRRDGGIVFKPKPEDIATGFSMTALPVASADRHSVRLDLNVNMSNLVAETVPMTKLGVQIDQGNGHPVQFVQFLQKPQVKTLSVDKKLTIPDGQTVVLPAGKREVEIRNECGCPFLSRVPYLNRLFTNVAYSREERSVFVLVTPRIILPAEECQQTGFLCETMPVCAAPPIAAAGEESEVCPPLQWPLVSVERQLLADFLKQYDDACATGQTEKAAKYAKAAIALDPTCFSKRHGQ